MVKPSGRHFGSEALTPARDDASRSWIALTFWYAIKPIIRMIAKLDAPAGAESGRVPRHLTDVLVADDGPVAALVPLLETEDVLQGLMVRDGCVTAQHGATTCIGFCIWLWSA